MNDRTTTFSLLNRLRMRQVALLLAIEARGTLRAAAEDVGMTQPAATKMLHELEDTLGCQLFDRIGRGLRLNAAGSCVTGHFRGMRGGLEAMRRDLHAIKLGSEGKLFVGSIMAAAPDVLTYAIVALKKHLPLLTVEIVVDTSNRLIERLREGQLDLVIGRMPGRSHADFHFKPLHDEALSVVAGVHHPLAKKTKLQFSQLLTYPWVITSSGSPMRGVLEQEFASNHRPMPQGLVETASILTTTQLVANSDMVAVIPASIATRYASHGLLSILPYTIRNRLPAYGSVTCADRATSPPLDLLLELLHQPGLIVAGEEAFRARKSGPGGKIK